MNIDYLDRANKQFYSKNYEAALENYDLAIHHCPSMPEAYYCRGLVKRIMGNHQAAIQDLSIATILSPKMVLAYYYRGIVYSEIGDYSYAIANYNHAIFLEPNLANAYYHRAIIYGELGRINLAIKDFQQAATLAKKQSNKELQKRAKKALGLAKKLKNANLHNRTLIGAFIFTLLTISLGMGINQLKHWQDNQRLDSTDSNSFKSFVDRQFNR